MILDSDIHKECYLDMLEFCELTDVNIEVLFLYTQIKKYCLNPPCSDKYKNIFKDASSKKMLEKAKQIKANKEYCFYPYSESMLNEIFESFIE